MVSRRAASIGSSPTLRISALAQAMRAEGIDVLDFSAGQPDFPVPAAAKRAASEALAQDRTRYTPNAGLPELRSAIAGSLARTRGLDYPPGQILVSTGAKASLYFAFLALVDAGDEVLVPAPYWVSYPEQVALAGGTPVIVPCPEQGGFKLTVDALERAASPRTRALVLNYPSNPTGACYRRDELDAIARFCVERGIWVLADEIYSRLVYDGLPFTSIAELSPEIRERTVVIDGMSKSYSMTGLRIGYAAGPEEVIAAMSRLQSHSTSNACSISQWASIEALASCEDEVSRRVAEFERRRDEIVRLLGEVDGVRCLVPDGAFYVFPSVDGLIGRRAGDRRIDGGDRFAEYLLAQARVAVVPGTAFGAPDHVRISYAVSVDRIREGVRRIAEAVAALAE
ncbi:MAG TPA: pyridoxal phosphate-dependent aminotransferase [Candidatus Polarisedimenticolaceae bacterium]|nr:pyridoxal phosphate-dependent aminotransferase [Candidatus Polarisedimenticolaceae bacterium]